MLVLELMWVFFIIVLKDMSKSLFSRSVFDLMDLSIELFLNFPQLVIRSIESLLVFLDLPVSKIQVVDILMSRSLGRS